MSDNDIINRVQGRTLPEIKVTMMDRNSGDPRDPSTWSILNIAGTTVTMTVRKEGTDLIIDSVSGSFITDGTDGKITFKLSPTIVDTALGIYEGEINIDYGAGDKLTPYNMLRFRFREDH